MNDIKPIETFYNGYRFRSRLEARWAVFFDALRIKYQYEPEGYKGFQNIMYLPDFYLPEEHIYVEVKGSDEALQRDAEKISAAIDWQSTPIAGDGLMILGDIPNPEQIDFANIPVFSYLYWHEGVLADYASFDYGPSRIRVGIGHVLKGSKQIMAEVFQLPCEEYSEYPSIPDNASTECVWTRDYRSFRFTGLKEAFRVARQARFEHGELPFQ